MITDDQLAALSDADFDQLRRRLDREVQRRFEIANRPRSREQAFAEALEMQQRDQERRAQHAAQQAELAAIQAANAAARRAAAIEAAEAEEPGFVIVDEAGGLVTRTGSRSHPEFSKVTRRFLPATPATVSAMLFRSEQEAADALERVGGGQVLRRAFTRIGRQGWVEDVDAVLQERWVCL